MDKKTVFVKTSKGAGEASNQSDHLYGDAKRVLLLVDDFSTVAEISKRAPPSLRATLEGILQDLVDGGYIRDSKEPEQAASQPALKFAAPKFATPKVPAKPAAPEPESSSSEDMELDFSFLASAPAKPELPKPAAARPEPPKPSSAEQEAAAAKARVEAEAKARQQAEAKARQDAEAARTRAAQQAQIEAQVAAAKAKAYAEAKARAKAEVEVRAKAEAEARAKQEAEAARIKAEKEAEAARAELEAAKAKAEAEARARAIAAARIKQEAEAARLKAEAEAAKARAELEAAKARMEAEVRARVEAEAKAKREAEEARLRAEREAERARAELEAARLRVEAEARAKAELEARLKAEAEEALARARQEEAKAKLEAETRIRLETEARMKAELEARMQREAEEARQQKEREELAARLSLDAEKAKADLEARLKLEAELKLQAEARIRAEVEARILQEEETARLQAAKVLVELDAAKAKAEADARALAEAEARSKAEAEAEARRKQEEAEALRKAEQEKADALARMDPAEKIRMSFAQSAEGRGRDVSGVPGDFKFDEFAVGAGGQKPAAPAADEAPVISLNFDALAAVPPASIPVPGSAKQAALEQRQKEEEAKRLKAEQEAAKLRAEQEATRLRAEQEAAARKAAEQEAARLKAEHEAYKARVEQEEAQARADEEARKQAAEQGKAWEEAEQRARAKAQAEKERQESQQAEEKVKATPKVPKARRKPLPIGKIAGALVVLALAGVLALPYVWPLGSYIAPLEQELAAQLHQPVRIGGLSASWSPAPRLEIRGVTVGRAQELKIGEAEVTFDFSALFSPTRSISTLKLSKLDLNGSSVIPVMGWMRSAGAMEKYPVATMQLEGVRVATEEIRVPELSGQAAFDAQGNFTKAELKSSDGKLGLELEAVQKHLQLVVNFRDTTLPTLPNVSFKDLTATGEILNGEIAFSDLYGHLYGGMLGGNARLNWSNGWLLQGRLVAKSFELQQLLPQYGISGEFYSDVNFTLSGDKLSHISDAPRMEGTFEAKQVTINKMDLETMARFGNRSDLARGRTNFDEVSGTVQSDSLGQRLRQMKFASSVMTGTGQLEVASQQLSGKLSVDLKGPHGGSATMLISGTPAEPAVRVR